MFKSFIQSLNLPATIFKTLSSFDTISAIGTLSTFGTLSIFFVPPAQAQSTEQISLPRIAVPNKEDTYKPAQVMEPKNIPDFSTNQYYSNTNSTGNTTSSRSATALRAEAASTTLPMQTRMKLILESPVDAKTSKPGDIFEGHVRDDFLSAPVFCCRAGHW